MQPDQKLTIYFAERLRTQKKSGRLSPETGKVILPKDGEVISWYHSFLALSGADQKAHIQQQLHFYTDRDLSVLPTLIDEERALDTFPDTYWSEYISGQAQHILPRWNHALKFANFVQCQSELKFGDNHLFSANAFNCRTGIKVAIQKMGLAFREEFTRSAAGLQADFVSSYPVFQERPRDIRHVLDENDRLVTYLSQG